MQSIYRRDGGIPVTVWTQIDDGYAFAEFAKGKDEAEIRAAFENGDFTGEARRVARAWLLRRERDALQAVEAEDRAERRRSIKATERTARWTLMAALGSLISALAAAAAVAIAVWPK